MKSTPFSLFLIKSQNLSNLHLNGTDWRMPGFEPNHVALGNFIFSFCASIPQPGSENDDNYICILRFV